MPLVTVSSRPNGLPIATTPSPTWSELESPSASVPELHGDGRGAVDDVLVRDDVAVRVVDEAGALRLLRLRAAAEVVRGGGLARDGDLDDALVGAAVDRVHGQRLGLRRRLRVTDGDLADDRVRAAGGEGGVDGRACAAGGDDQGCEDGEGAAESHLVQVPFTFG
jgi:hypothetical protein